MALDPELKPFIDRLDAAWPEYPLSLDVATWRDRIERAARPFPSESIPGMSTEDAVIAASPRNVEIRIHRPAANGPMPLVIYMHGGGWVVGSHHGHDGITSALAQAMNAVVVSVHYARAPEHPYPAAVEDCAAVMAWAFAHATDLGSSPDDIFVMGDSAGGNLATVLALINRDRAQPHRLRGQVLLYPVTDTDFSRPSYLSEANAPFLKGAEMIWFWGRYCPDPVRRREPYATPIHAPDLSGLPPALVLVAEHDPLRDEGEAYARRLADAGVETVFRPGLGLIHGFMRATGVCAAAKAEFDAIVSWVDAHRLPAA